MELEGLLPHSQVPANCPYPVLCTRLPDGNVRTVNKLSKGKAKGKFHSRTGHEAPEG